MEDRLTGWGREHDHARGSSAVVRSVATCGDFKRWCPDCNQGWIRRFRVPTTGTELYSCDECEATWPSVAEIRTPGASRRSVLRLPRTGDAWPRLELVRERSPKPSAD